MAAVIDWEEEESLQSLGRAPNRRCCDAPGAQDRQAELCRQALGNVGAAPDGCRAGYLRRPLVCTGNPKFEPTWFAP